MPDLKPPPILSKPALTITLTVVFLAFLPYLSGKKLTGVQPARFEQLFAFARRAPAQPAAKQPEAKQVKKVREQEPKPSVIEPDQNAVATAVANASPQLTVPPGSLDHFFSALRRSELREAGAVTRVLHYGDSPTTADSITADVRSLLQSQFGDAGHGFVLIAKPWAWYNHRGIGLDAKGWRIEAASMGRAKDGVHGLGGVSFRGEAGAVSRVRLPDDLHTRAVIYYWAQPGGGTFRVSAAGASLAETNTARPEEEPAWLELQLPPGTKELELSVLSGSVRLFGYRFDKDGPGVQYSSLGVNGAQVQMVVRFFEVNQWSAFLRHESPDLVVLNYGTNESIFPDYIQKQYPNELRTVVARLRAALPDASIMLMSPMDRGIRGENGDIDTPDALPRLIEVQRQVAAEAHLSFFNTYEAMGGKGTMGRWYKEQPRLVSADFMHPLPAGAAKVAALFEEALVGAYHAQQKALGATPSAHRDAAAGPVTAENPGK